MMSGKWMAWGRLNENKNIIIAKNSKDLQGFAKNLQRTFFFNFRSKSSFGWTRGVESGSN